MTNENEIFKGEILEGFAVSGEYVSNLKDKSAIIIKVPHYESFPDPDHEGQTLKKLVLRIELSDKAQMDYYPNGTSRKEMGNAWGVLLEKWLSKRFEFEIVKQKVRGMDKLVLFAKALK